MGFQPPNIIHDLYQQFIVLHYHRPLQILQIPYYCSQILQILYNCLNLNMFHS